MAPGIGIEPMLSSICLSDQVRYPGGMEQVMGVEPTSSAWKADALTVVLHLQMVGHRGLEPGTRRL